MINIKLKSQRLKVKGQKTLKMWVLTSGKGYCYLFFENDFVIHFGIIRTPSKRYK